MKYLITVYLFLIPAFLLYSQENKNGRIFINGNISFSYSSNSSIFSNLNMGKNHTIVFVLNPKAGYFLNENIAFGLGLDMNSMFLSADDNSSIIESSTASHFSVAPFIRYYFIENWFGEGSLDFGKTYSKTTYSSTNLNYSENANNFGFGASLGYSWFLKQYISLEPALKYSFLRSFYHKQTNTNNTFLVSVGLSYIF